MEKRCCWNCVYGKKPEDRWLRIALARWPGMLICSACADCPGRTCGVYAGSYCRNFCPKPGVQCGPRGPAIPEGEPVCKIPLTQGLFAIVDPEDFEELNKHKWCIARSDGICYAVRKGPDGRLIMMHREIMKTPEGMVVDHKNLDGLDNRKVNMRNGTKAQNCYNHRPPRGGTGFKGVKYIAEIGKYKATVGHQGKAIVLGLFDDPIEAAKARDRVARELHGEFAYLNFPDEFAGNGKADSQQGPSETSTNTNSKKKRPSAKRPRRRIVNLSGTAVIHTSARGRLSITESSPEKS